MKKTQSIKKMKRVIREALAGPVDAWEVQTVPRRLGSSPEQIVQDLLAHGEIVACMACESFPGESFSGKLWVCKYHGGSYDSAE